MESLGQSNETVNLQDLCMIHQREYKLFCLECVVAICGACMDKGEHDLHQISSIAVVYGEKLAIVKDKLTQVEKCHDSVRVAFSSVVERNLQSLEKEETINRNEIEELLTDVEGMTLNVATHDTEVLMDLKSKVEQLSANEFLHKFSEIVEQCDELMGAPQQDVNDIQCLLFTPYQFDLVVFPRFAKAKLNDKYDFIVKSAYDVEWRLIVIRSDILQIRLCTADAQISIFRHALTVAIPHADETKEILKTFEVTEQDSTFSMVQTNQILEQHFCNNSGDLLMKIGIRPLNSLIEKQLASHQYVQLKEANDKLSKQLQSYTDDHYCNHLNMYFNLKLTELLKGKFLKSYRIYDEENREWCMNLKLKKDNTVHAYVQLFKGSGTNCSFFIELMHENPEKVARRHSIRKKFDLGSGNESTWGFALITLDELNSDLGFQSNGYLHFRFGVRPLPATESDGGSTPAKQTAVMTPAELNEGKRDLAQNKHVSFSD